MLFTKTLWLHAFGVRNRVTQFNWINGKNVVGMAIILWSVDLRITTITFYFLYLKNRLGEHITCYNSSFSIVFLNLPGELSSVFDFSKSFIFPWFIVERKVIETCQVRYNLLTCLSVWHSLLFLSALSVFIKSLNK